MPDGAVMECNLDYLYQYETRKTWIRYGHIAYLGTPPSEDSALPGPLLAVWSCHHQKLVRPGDSLWEHAKLGTRPPSKHAPHADLIARQWPTVSHVRRPCAWPHPPRAPALPRTNAPHNPCCRCPLSPGFRSTLGMSLTCRDHLAWLHWIRANGLHNAARETLGADHPVRRLLKQHYYGTGEINFSSKDMLLPVGQFAHRTFGLTDEGWIKYFTDVTRDFK